MLAVQVAARCHLQAAVLDAEIVELHERCRHTARVFSVGFPIRKILMQLYVAAGAGALQIQLLREERHLLGAADRLARIEQPRIFTPRL
jgi:hypothetical protein